MDIKLVADIIEKIADGIEEACSQCLSDNSHIILLSIKEQLYSGQSGNDKFLTPTYDDDPFFNEEGPWKGRASQYKAWKRDITPPQSDYIFPLGLPARPEYVPNLFINGKFYSEITAQMNGRVLMTAPGAGIGPDIVSKYGDEILRLGSTATAYFNATFMLPAISNFFEKCGYR